MSAPSLPGGAPDISFIVAVHNVGTYIEAALRSALAQMDCSVEVIVVDDASTDDGAAIVMMLASEDARIRLIRRPVCGGASAARNEGIGVAAGVWLAVLDGDDLIAPGRSRFLLDFAAMTSADLVADNITRFGDGFTEVTALSRGPAPYAVQLDVAGYMRGNCPMSPGPNLGYLKPMIRRSFYDRHGLRYDERLRIGEDYRLCLEALLASGRFLISSEPFYFYRVRAGSLSWRLSPDDIDRMSEAHAAVMAGLGPGCSPTIHAAGLAYSRALLRSRVIHVITEAAKRGDWLQALRLLFLHPDSWGFLARVGQNVARRRLRPRPVTSGLVRQ